MVKDQSVINLRWNATIIHFENDVELILQKKQREWEKQVIDNLQKEKKYKSRQCIIITLKMIEEEPPARSMAY